MVLRSIEELNNFIKAKIHESEEWSQTKVAKALNKNRHYITRVLNDPDVGALALREEVLELIGYEMARTQQFKVELKK